MKEMKELAINDKQRMFCYEYLKDFNGKQAAIRSGYSKKTAESIASRLLRNVKVLELLNKLKEEHVLKANLSVDDIINELKTIGFAKADGEIVKTSHKIKALEILGKHLGMFKEVSEPDTEVKFICQVNIIRQEIVTSD